jgi:hypothetical protein
VAGVIAAQEEGSARQVVPSLHRERAIAGEKCPAKPLEHCAADRWRQKRAIRFSPAGHSVSIYQMGTLPFECVLILSRLSIARFEATSSIALPGSALVARLPRAASVDSPSRRSGGGGNAPDWYTQNKNSGEPKGPTTPQASKGMDEGRRKRRQRIR